MLWAEASGQHIDTQLSVLTALLPHNPGPLMDNFRWHLDWAKGYPSNCKALHLNILGRGLNLLKVVGGLGKGKGKLPYPHELGTLSFSS